MHLYRPYPGIQYPMPDFTLSFYLLLRFSKLIENRKAHTQNSLMFHIYIIQIELMVT